MIEHSSILKGHESMIGDICTDKSVLFLVKEGLKKKQKKNKQQTKCKQMKKMKKKMQFLFSSIRRDDKPLIVFHLTMIR